MSGATSRALALTVNAIAAAMIDGVSLQPGDRYAAVADIVARTVHKECTLDHAALAQSCFVIPSARIEERTLGGGAWFYANFMDAASFPVLACLLQPPRVPDGYGAAAAPAPREGEAGDRAETAAAPVKRARAGGAGAEARSRRARRSEAAAEARSGAARRGPPREKP